MNEEEARSFMNRLVGAFGGEKFRDKDFGADAKTEYLNCLMALKYSIASRTVDELINNNKFMPSIAEIRDCYGLWYKYDDQQKHQSSQVNCYVCMDAGVVPIKETHDGCLNMFCYWCDACKQMQQNSMIPISRVIDPIEIEQSNKMEHTGKVTPMPDYVKEKLVKFCRKVKI